MSPTRILPFDPYRDDDQLYALFDQIVAVGEGFPQAAPLTRSEYEYVWRKPDTSVFVARSEEQGRLVGAYYLKPNQPGRAAHIANAGYVVSSAARGQGLGRKLVEHSIEAAPGLGYDAIQFNLVFESNPARAMYEELGWQQIGRVPDAVEGEAAIIYWRRVAGGGETGTRFARFVGIDWSGAVARAGVFVAEAVPGEGGVQGNSVQVQGVRASSRADVERVLLGADRMEPTLFGADFSFSFPSSFALGGRTDWTWPELTAWAAELVPTAESDALSALERAPERPQFRLPQTRGGQGELYRDRVRATEAAVAANTVFNLVGARQVGLGSIHGMAMLDRLRGTPGLAIWPFQPAHDVPAVLAEVYPKQWLHPSIRKNRREDRLNQVGLWREAGHVIPADVADAIERSDDALDAVAVAIGIAQLGRLPDPASLPPEAAREGWILGPIPSPG